MGDFKSISLERGLNQNGTADEGYLRFGCLLFQSDTSICEDNNYARKSSGDNNVEDGNISSEISNITPKKPEIVTCVRRDTGFLEIDQTSDLASSSEMKEGVINQRLQKVEVLLEEVIKNQSYGQS